MIGRGCRRGLRRMSIVQTVLNSSHFKVMTQDCSYPRVNCGHGEGEPGRFLFTRRGAFSIQVGQRSCLARPGQAVFLGRDVEYRVSHPDHRGCACCTDVWLDDAWLDELGLGAAHAPACLDVQHDLHLQQAHVELLLGMRRGPDLLEAEEAMLAVLDGLMHGGEPRPTANSGTARQVRRAQEAIVASPGENLGVDALSRLVGCSPFHLCRIFRQGTGQSLRQFRLQHRLGTALDRLGEGEEDLAALACDVGFSSHSHMTDAFRQALGATPSELREGLRRSELATLKSRLLMGQRSLH